MLAFALALVACSRQAPIRIGFLGGFTDRASSLSEDARNGVMLGLEQLHQQGGIDGRQAELIVKDYDGDVDKAASALQALVDAHVDVVIGPFSSTVATRILPLADEARMLVLLPTGMAVALAGRDDYMIRLNRTTRDSARSYAQMLRARGLQRVALARDMRNALFAAAWSEDFRTAFTAIGGTVVPDADFGTDATPAFEQVVRDMLVDYPDGLVFVANAADAARLAQQAAKLASTLPVAAVDGAATAALIELGGQAVEGMVVAQGYKIDDESPRYQAFHAAYLARFGRVPTQSAIASYDAVSVFAQAMGRRAVHGGSKQSARDAVLQNGPYQGLQQTIRFDRFGDAERDTYFSVVRQGRFVAFP